MIVHEASSEHMDFQSKNFAYVNKAFGEFIDQAKDGGRLYLRSVSSQNPTQQPADIKRDFPSLADDFKLPPEVAIAHENFHSSPLRISGVSERPFSFLREQTGRPLRHPSRDIVKSSTNMLTNSTSVER